MQVVSPRTAERPRIAARKAKKRPWARTLSAAKVRSALTNGSTAVLGGIDHRSAWARRLRDLVARHLADLGGADAISEAECRLVQRAAMLCLQLEMIEARWAAANNGEAEGLQSLEAYQRCTNTLRRVLEALGLQRRARDVTPPRLHEYLRQNSGGVEADR